MTPENEKKKRFATFSRGIEMVKLIENVTTK